MRLFKLAVTTGTLLAASACGSPADTTSSGSGGQPTSSSSSANGGSGAGGSGNTGGLTGTGGGAGGSGNTGGLTGAGGSVGGSGTGGAPDPECAIPPGASDLIHVGVPAAGLVCKRYPFPLAAPRDVMEASDGTIFVTEFGAGKIVRLTGNGFVTLAQGLVAPIGLREDDDGSLLVTEEGAQSLARIDRTTGARTEIADVGHNVTYLTRGPDGAAYMSSFQELADTKKGIVYRVDLGSGMAAPFATGLNVPEGLFFNPAGQLHVAEWLLPSAVFRFPAGGGGIAGATKVAEGFNNIYGLTGDGNGGFYGGDHAGRVVHVASDGTTTDVVTNIGRPGGLWLSAGGVLWVAEFVDFGQTGYLIRISGL